MDAITPFSGRFTCPVCERKETMQRDEKEQADPWISLTPEISMKPQRALAIDWFQALLRSFRPNASSDSALSDP